MSPPIQWERHTGLGLRSAKIIVLASMNRKGRPNNQLGDYLISLADACQIGRGRYLALDFKQDA
jgi:hypothetical protein